MTTGNFNSVPLDDIWVDRDKRQRRELVNIEELAESISRIGLIHPIVIQKTGELRVGERRFNAVKQLGWTHIPVQYVEDMDEHQLQILELEENIRREDLPWQDHCDTVRSYHQLRTESQDGWTQTQTSEALGMSKQEITDKLSVASEIEAGNERVLEAPKYSVARGIVRREGERKKASAIAEISGEEPVTKPGAIPLKNVDFLKWVEKYSGPKFNFIHCDFPYGVGADKHAQGAGKAHGGYDDDKEVFFSLINGLKKNMDKIVAESAHIMFWFSMDSYSETKLRLIDMGWEVQPFPLVWFKSDNTGILPDPSRGPRRVYETALIGSRGDRKIVQAVANVFPHPVVKTVHMSEKPRAMLAHFFRMFVDEYSLVLDPTCGSGNAIAVAEEMGAPTTLGLEKSREFYQLARENYHG